MLITPLARSMFSRMSDMLDMTKPRVVLLMLACALVGMLMAAQGTAPIPLMIAGLFGIALVGGSAAVVNHVVDARWDLRMERTRSRPVATGRVSEVEALVFSGVLGVAGLFVLFYWVNPLAAYLNVISWVGYGLIYSIFLKHKTSQNIVIGGLFGAAPPAR